VHQQYNEVLAELDANAPPPNFKTRPRRTFNTEMPVDFDEEAVVRSWDKLGHALSHD